MAPKKPTKKPKFSKPTPAKTGIGQFVLHGTGKPSYCGWSSAIFLLHALGLALLFTPWQGIVNIHPVIDQDWGLHFHHLKSLEAFWRESGRFWGYNPSFMAGYPSNTIQDLSIKFFEFVALGLSTVTFSPVQWLKLTTFLAMASVPWLMYLAVRNFFFAEDSKNVTALAAALLGTIYWWNSLPREMFFYGMIGFPVASYLSVWGVSLFYRLAMQPPSLGVIHAGWLILVVVILPLHVQSVVTFLPPMVTLLIVQPRVMTAKLWVWLTVAAALSLIVNSVWLVPAFNHRGDDVSSAIVNQLPLFASTDPFMFLIDYLGTKGYWTFRPTIVEKGFRLTLLILGGLGTWKLIQSQKRSPGIMLAAALAVLFVVSYFGAQIPLLTAWQPLRFKVPLDIFLAVGAAYIISQWFTGLGATRSRLVPVLLALGGGAFLINLVQTESTGKLQLRTRIIPELTSIVEWIQRDTSTEARVLFEESGDETGFVYDGMYLSSFIPHLTGRQLIGGPINLYNDRHHFAEFHSGKLFKKEIQTLSVEELQNYLRLYNIGSVVAFHPASVQRLQSIPGLVTVDQRIGPVHLMKVNQPLTWFVEGEGKVKAGLNRLELTELKGNPVIIKYHWIAGLQSEPAANIEPVKLADDPIPFIKIVDPPAALILRVGS